MILDNRCTPAPHVHVGACARAGYALGRADVIEAIEAVIAEHANEFRSDPDYLIVDVEKIRAALV